MYFTYENFVDDMMNLASEAVGGGDLNILMSSYQYRDPMLKIRRSGNRLIFNMEISILGKTVFILRRGPVIKSIQVLIS